MADFLKKTFQKVAERLKSLTKGQKTRLIVLVVLVAGIILTASVLLNQKSYVVLYSGMDPADAGEVLSMLDGMGVDAKAQGTSTILVESSEADSLRMQLAAEGYPKSGYNFDIFEKASGLGTTDMEKRVYYQYQLQADIADWILHMSKVQDAVVSLYLPEDDNFVLNTDVTPATAGVILTLKEGQTLTNVEARAIAEVVSTSVGGLELENVRIIDSEMNLYDLTEEENPLINVGDQYALQQSVQGILKEQVLRLLGPVFGQNGVLSEVNVILDFDTQTKESVVFNPPVEGSDEGLAVSIKELAETVRGEAAADEVAGIEANGGGTTTYPSVEADEDSVFSSVSKEANYELNETKTRIEAASGYIRDLSVSVILDSSVIEEDYTENVRNLVATAIGVDISRVTVERLPFLPLNTSDSDVSAAFALQKEMLDAANQASLIKSLITAGTIIVVFLLLLAAIRTLRRSAVPVKEIEAEYPEGIEGEPASYPVYYETPASSGGKPADGASGESFEEETMEFEEEGPALDIAVGEENELPPPTGRLKGRAARKAAKEKAEEAVASEQQSKEPEPEPAKPKIVFPEIEIKEDTNLTQLENYIDKSPESVALLLRNWLSDER